MGDNAVYQANAGFGAIVAGMALTALDGIEIDPTGAAWKTQVTDYAAVSAVGQVIAETVLESAGIFPVTYLRAPILNEPVRGDIYEAFPNNGGGASTGLSLNRYNSAGQLINTAVVDSADQMEEVTLTLLANDSVLLSFLDVQAGPPGILKFIIFDAFLQPQTVVTTVESVQNAAYDVAALSGGGFAFNYLKATTATQRLAIYNNAGGSVLPPTTWSTWTGTPGTVLPKVGQNSSGNIILLAASQYTSTPGLYIAIYSAAGAQQLAATQLINALPTVNALPYFSAITGFFAVGYPATTYRVAVLNDAGAQQGATFTLANPSGTWGASLINNTVDTFYFQSVSSAASDVTSTPISTAGAAGTSHKAASTTAASYNITSFFDRGRIVLGLAQGGAHQQKFAVFNPTTNVIEKDSTAYGTAPATAMSGNQRLLPGGDFTFISGYSFQDGSDEKTVFYVGKYTASAFIGQCINSAAKDAIAYLHALPNMYLLNPMIGSPSVAFDHNAATPHGNKGTLMQHGCSVEGL